MYRIAIVVLLVAVLGVGSALAGIPAPPNCTCSVGGMGATCQYRFNAAGELDTMRVVVVLRDTFGAVCPNVTTQVTLAPRAGTVYFCSCCPNPQLLVSDAQGRCVFEFARLGGHGELDINVTAYDPDSHSIPICNMWEPFTSPDLDASCDVVAPSSTGVIDLGLWAACLPPGYCRYGAYSCGFVVGVVDLGVWASGLGKNCVSPNPNCPY